VLKNLMRLSLILILTLSLNSCAVFKPKPVVAPPVVVYQAPPGYVLTKQADFDRLKADVSKAMSHAAEIKTELDNCLKGKAQ